MTTNSHDEWKRHDAATLTAWFALTAVAYFFIGLWAAATVFGISLAISAVSAWAFYMDP